RRLVEGGDDLVTRRDLAVLLGEEAWPPPELVGADVRSAVRGEGRGLAGDVPEHTVRYLLPVVRDRHRRQHTVELPQLRVVGLDLGERGRAGGDAHGQRALRRERLDLDVDLDVAAVNLVGDRQAG